MSSRQRAVRDAQIVAMRARGAQWADIAAQFDVSERQAKRVFASWRDDEQSSEYLDPAEAIRSTLELLRQGIADMAELEVSADNDSARIGATRLKVEIAERLLELLSAVGVLPRNLRALRLEDEMQQVLRSFMEVLRRHDVGDEVLQELHDVAERGRQAVRAPSARAWLSNGSEVAA